MKTRGERLKARRLEMKLTLREVAEAVDISIAGVQNLQTWRRNAVTGDRYCPG